MSASAPPDSPPFAKERILVVEDVAVIAKKLKSVLAQAGASVIGPIASLDSAMNTVRADDAIDAAVVDIDLRGRMAFPLFERLCERGIRFMLITGYDPATLPDPWAASMAVIKPFTSADLIRAIVAVLDAPAPEPATTKPFSIPGRHERQRLEVLKEGRNAMMESSVLIDEAKSLRTRL